jgi:hypothetical protein
VTLTPSNGDREIEGGTVARLVIFRGDAHHADIQLPEQTVRIGRSPQNDIVLEDQGKGVSRTHAELRFEDGRYVLVDKESNNGVWVSGARVTSVVLDPGVVATVGPYRLSVERSASTQEIAAPEDPTEIAVRPPRLPQPVEELPPHAEAADEDRGTVGPSAESTRPAGVAPPSGKSRVPLLAAAAVLLLSGAGYGAYTILRGGSPPPAPDWVTSATEMVNAGRCPDALTQHIGPALERNPQDPEALRLKARCEPTPASPTREPEAPPPPTAADVLLGEADVLIASNQKPANKECQAALEKINEVLANDPANGRAQGLKQTADACLQSRPTPTRLTVWIAEVDPEKGGLPPLPKETPKEHEARVREANARLDEAKTRAEAGDYDAAEKGLEGLPPKFRGVAELAGSIRTARNRRQAAALLAQAREAAGRDEFSKAEDLYRRARELDARLPVDKELQEMDGRRQQLAQAACKRANARYISRLDDETRRLYSEALKLLKAGELCYDDAIQRSK